MSAIAVAPAGSVTPHLATSEVRFRRILLAVDFSEQTSRVLATGIRIAKEFNSQLFLVYAATPAVYGTGAEPIPIETFDVSLQIARERMAELTRNTPQLTSFAHEEIVAYARPLDLIQEIVEDKKIDLVIAGSHGASGMERLALGSIAECILRTIRCPVLVIGPKATLSAELFRSIVLAASLEAGELRSVQYATCLAEHSGGKLTLLHAVESPGRNSTVQPELLERHILQQLLELVPGDFASRATAEFRVEHGKPGALIVARARSAQATLIVSGAREEGTLADHSLRATLAYVIQHSPCPVLCVRGHVV